MSARIRKLVENVHMGLGHEGLAKLLKRAGINVNSLAEGDLIMCLNTKGDKLKVIGGRGLVIGYLRMPRSQRIMKEALQYIPRTFGASGFDYDAACKTSLEKRLGLNKQVTTGPLKEARALKQAGL